METIWKNAFICLFIFYPKTLVVYLGKLKYMWDNPNSQSEMLKNTELFKHLFCQCSKSFRYLEHFWIFRLGILNW